MKNFHKILIEAGRTKLPEKGRRRKWRKGDGPDKEPMRPKVRHGYRELRDNLRPLFRWLCSQCGRPWNKVYSEIKKIPGEGVTMVHLKQHLEWWIEKYPIYIDGKPYHPISHWKGEPNPINDHSFYVDTHGIFRRGPKKKKSKPFKDKYTYEQNGITYYITDKNIVLTADTSFKYDQDNRSVIKYLDREDHSLPWTLKTIPWQQQIPTQSTTGYYRYNCPTGPFKTVYKSK